MRTVARRVGDVVQLERRPVEVDAFETYREIGVRSFGRGIFHKEPVSGTDLGSKRVFHIQSGDLVLSNVFAWEGAIALATEGEAGRIGSHRFMTYVPADEAVDAGYLRYFFLSEPGLQLIGKASPGSAGRNRTLAIDRFEDLVIPLPQIEEQRALVSWLDRILQRQEVALAALETHSADTFARALPALVEAELQNAADSVTTLADLVKLVGDVVHPGDDASPAKEFVGLQHVESHTGRRLGAEPVGNEKGRKFRFEPGDIVYGYLRPYLNKAWVADRNGLCSVDQYVIRPTGRIRVRLLGHILRSLGTLKQARDLTHNLQLPRLRSGLLMAIKVPNVPPERQLDLEVRLDAFVERVMGLAAARRRQRETLSALGKAALNRAFTSVM
jgi:type I restriction enzyme, S subunit